MVVQVVHTSRSSSEICGRRLTFLLRSGFFTFAAGEQPGGTPVPATLTSQAGACGRRLLEGDQTRCTRLRPYTDSMTAVPIPDDLAARLERRARREGVPTEQVIERALSGYLAQDPYEFFEVGSSEELRGADADERLVETEFGHPRSSSSTLGR